MQTAPAVPGLVVLDLSDSDDPREVARLALDPEVYPSPHWLAADRASNRLVVTGADRPWVLVVTLDPATGDLAIDESFSQPGSPHPGISFARDEWPHGKTGDAWVHGALFGE